ncbi:MAG TPA: 3'-5' exonuclease [Planctomycetaceae bacterium]|nr:3'-5' exonuclease [Planctomycetaceae bacterium]HRF02501.1 3'-5' exonuclease [Pirellulaceae bacterium]
MKEAVVNSERSVERPAYFVFDVESVADGELVARVRYPGETLAPETAVERYRAQLLEDQGSDFIPYTYQVPLAIVVAKVAEDFRLLDLVSLDEPHHRPHELTRLFWAGWEAYRQPTFVTFNGRAFDLPLLELAAFRFGIGVRNWFNVDAKSWDQKRNRYNLGSHLDLYDILTNFGASRFSGGLDLAANLLGKPGKLEVKGHMVQDLYHQGRLQEISDYCRCDVLDTYFVFLRSRVLLGHLSLEREQELVDATRDWLEARRETCAAYGTYLAQWGDWVNPW